MATQNKNLSEYDKSALPSVAGKKFGLVVSDWNREITNSLYQGAVDTLKDCGVDTASITTYQVPGSFELIFGSRKMMRDVNPDAIIAIGSVIRGETAHFDYVCEAVAQGIQALNLMGEVPVIFCVLTDDTWEQAKARSGGQHGNKGVEAAIAAIKMTGLPG